MKESELKVIALILDTHPASGLRGYNLPLARVTRSPGTYFLITQAAASSLARAASVPGAYFSYCRTIGSAGSLCAIAPTLFHLLAEHSDLPGVMPGSSPMIRSIHDVGLCSRTTKNPVQTKAQHFGNLQELELKADAILENAVSVEGAIRAALADAYRTSEFLFLVACAAIKRELALGDGFSRLIDTVNSDPQ